MNSADPLVRQAASLQKTADVGDGAVHINSAVAARLGLSSAKEVLAEQEESSLTLPLVIDERVADDCVLIHAKQGESAALGPWFAEVKLEKAAS